MLTAGDNERLTRVGPSTPMGEYMRRFWQPALLSRELPGPDCPPVRVRILGEDLVAFRDSNGAVGVLDAHCPHRGAPLFFGRNEECGLRCVYHGWKFDTEGRCVDMPNVPGGGSPGGMRTKAYPTHEAGHLVWVYMGPPDARPELPQFEFLKVPSDHVYAHKRIQECNYLQVLEGEMDSSHVSFLHRRMDDFFGADAMKHPMFTDTAPRFEVKQTHYGQMVAARREAGPDAYFYRVTQLLLPCHVLVGVLPGAFMDCSSSVPMDDETTLGFTIAWRNDRPLDARDMALIESGEFAYPRVDEATFVPLRNRRNDYMIDREAQRTASFTGIIGVREQDAAIQEGMGPICDRTREHLCASDAAIKSLRRRLLDEVGGLQEGRAPVAVARPETYCVRAANALVPRETSWLDATRADLLGLGQEELAIIA